MALAEVNAMKATFLPLDQGTGCVTRDSLHKVLTDINPDVFTSTLIDAFIGHNGEVVSYSRFIDALFWDEQWTKRKLSIAGLVAPSAASPDERLETERAVSQACLELTGQFSGQYFPMPSSLSFAAQPGGMTSGEAQALKAHGLMFDSREAAGRGVFANDARDVAVWVNADQHINIVVKQRGPLGTADAEQRIGLLESSLRQTLQQDGLFLTEQ
eukprot:TRINITY_DN63002_c0_g1_i1.p1 TRINITY_DN63002_c0_g1~~TRINITY_DN63002_c0_g1_i1.p1  ORF type:complete len:214 (+),score=51.54 TRINITY_DN63002_c0_g1_i1:91-732(+)